MAPTGCSKMVVQRRGNKLTSLLDFAHALNNHFLRSSLSLHTVWWPLWGVRTARSLRSLVYVHIIHIVVIPVVIVDMGVGEGSRQHAVEQPDPVVEQVFYHKVLGVVPACEELVTNRAKMNRAKMNRRFAHCSRSENKSCDLLLRSLSEQ